MASGSGKIIMTLIVPRGEKCNERIFTQPHRKMIYECVGRSVAVRTQSPYRKLSTLNIVYIYILNFQNETLTDYL